MSKKYIVTLAIIGILCVVTFMFLLIFSKHGNNSNTDVGQINYHEDEEDFKPSGYYVIRYYPGDTYEPGEHVDLASNGAEALDADEKLSYIGVSLYDRPLLLDANGTVQQWPDLADDSEVGDSY